jgi:glycolate oxidase iron-sulfur subunit
MDKNKSLKDFEGLIRECVKCGVCQAHCPTYLVNKKEGSVARGKIALAAALLDKEADLDERLQEDISMCLMCGSCLDKCPNKVPTNEIVGAIRRKITDNQGLSLIGKGVSAVLSHKILIKTLGKGGALMSPLLLKSVPESSGLRLRFPSPVMKDRTVPKVPFRNLFERVPEFTEAEEGKGIVGFFAGCALTYIYPETGKIMIDILLRMGYSVYVPRSQGCCGIPALSSGNGTLVTDLAGRNVDAFDGKNVEHIVTACASCNGGIGEHYRSMKADFSEFTGKVVDFSVFLKQNGLFEELEAMDKWQNGIRVTYHDPCHLKTQGIVDAPRELLKNLPNVDFVEMEKASSCCGLGGTFSVYHYNTSKNIGAIKLSGIEESGAELVATGCPGCIMQLQDIINHGNLKVKAVHILSLLAQALE